MLVCDVGGGTTDFSLIEVTDDGGALALARIAVGDHILLGGDNMDLTLAYGQKTKLEAAGHTLDAFQLRALMHACRTAKEQLLTDEGAPASTHAPVHRGMPTLSSLHVSAFSQLPEQQLQDALHDIASNLQTSPSGLQPIGLRQTPTVKGAVISHVTG